MVFRDFGQLESGLSRIGPGLGVPQETITRYLANLNAGARRPVPPPAFSSGYGQLEEGLRRIGPGLGVPADVVERYMNRLRSGDRGAPQPMRRSRTVQSELEDSVARRMGPKQPGMMYAY